MEYKPDGVVVEGRAYLLKGPKGFGAYLKKPKCLSGTRPLSLDVLYIALFINNIKDQPLIQEAFETGDAQDGLGFMGKSTLGRTLELFAVRQGSRLILAPQLNQQILRSTR